MKKTPTTLLGLHVVSEGYENFDSAYNQKMNLNDNGSYFIYRNPRDKLFYVLVAII